MSTARALAVVGAGVVAIVVMRALMRDPRRRLSSRVDRVAVPFSTVILLGAVSGGFSGLAEAGHLALRHVIEGNLARSFGWDVLWMAPAVGVLIFGLLGLLLAVLFPLPRAADAADGRSGRLGDVALLPCLFLLVTLAAFSVLQAPHFGLYGWSAWLLSLGLAVLAVRWASARGGGMTRGIARVARWSLPGFVLLALGGLWYMPKPRESRAMSRLPAPAGDRPNVLLLVLDTVRAASLGLYGHARPTTPQLERLAKRGVVFDWAISTAPWTLPSHASMFTGLYPSALEVDYNVPLAEHHQTLAEALRGMGYATAGFVANMAFTTRISGLAQGFARYEDAPMTWGRFVESAWLSRTIGRKLLPLSRKPWRGASRKHAGQNIDDFLGWLDSRRQPERPFFAFLNFIDAHDPYASPRKFRERFEPQGRPLLTRKPHVTEERLASTRAAYEASIAMVDEELGRLMGELERRQLFDRTVIIVVSDHGEQFGEHGLQFHGNSLYLPLLHVPLMLVYPRAVPTGMRVHRPVSIRDIPVTVMQLVAGPADSSFPGQSLLGQARLADSAPVAPLLSVRRKPFLTKPWEPSVEGTMRSLFQMPYHLIRLADGRQELYQVEVDPEEKQDLAASADPALVRRLASTLDSLLAGEKE